MNQKKQRVVASIHPITTEEVALIRQRMGASLQDNSDLATRFDALMVTSTRYLEPLNFRHRSVTFRSRNLCKSTPVYTCISKKS